MLLMNSDMNIEKVMLMKNENTEGVISLAINKENGYIALLMFIYKDSNEGLIEEIATGEGKFTIIASLSIYFALRKYKVDIITSGYILAQ